MNLIESDLLKVLVVDDSPFMVEVMSTTLNQIGISKISTAEGGTAASKILNDPSTQFDIIICDLNMPDMDGLAFIRHLSGLRFGGAILLVSGEDERILKAAETLVTALDLHLLGALKKPVTIKSLTEKLEGLKGLVLSKESMPDETPVSKEEILHAIENDEFVVYFQPKVATRTRTVFGVESLVRWQSPKRGLVPPGLFISVAEREDLINMLTDVIIAKAFAWGARWEADGLNLKVAVNLSVDCLNNLELPEFLVNEAKKAGLSENLIILEITESRLIEGSYNAIEVLSRLALKGFQLSIDDFGTGYSSMEKLTQFPFGELKIDRAFVHDAENDHVAYSIFDSSMNLAKSLDMVTVAEGVENQSDLNVVSALGCDLVQGYFFAKPMPGDELADWVAEHCARNSAV